MSQELEERYQKFKWEVLGDSVDEDWQGLWEPLFWARTVFADLTEAERQSLAEAALRELFAEGLIFFFRGRDGVEQEVLDKAIVEDAIAGPTWRTVPIDASTDIWFGGTEEGERAVRAHWAGTTTPGFRAEQLSRFRRVDA